MDLITNPKVKSYILKKKKEKEELKRFRQSGGERGLAARKAKGIHGKLDLESASDDEEMDVASSESEQEVEEVKAVAKVGRKAPKKLTKKKIGK